MAVSESQVRQLRAKVDVEPKMLRAALTATRGDVDKALLHLIDSGQIGYGSLQAAEVPETLFVRAHKAWLKAQLAKYLDMLKRFPNDEFVAPASRACRDELRGMLKDPKTFQGLRDEMLAAQQSSQQRRAREKSAGTVKLPPLPALKSDGMDEWSGQDALRSWAGYRAGAGNRPSKGNFRATVARQEDRDDNPRPPAAEQIAAYRFLKDNEKKITDAVLKAVLKAFTKLKRDGYFDESDEPAPAITSVADLKRNIELLGVHLFDYAKSGHAYIGTNFGCTWDEEHGLGLILHKSRVVAVGQADTAWDHYAAKDDGGKKIR
jgi:hypothetical protein